MKNYWWKILGVLLVLYSLVAGLLIPLKPGIMEVEPARIRTGESVDIHIRGYNTRFASATRLRAWLKLDDERALAAHRIQVVNDNEMIAGFRVPPVLPVEQKVQDFSLVLDSETDGATVYPNAVFITQDRIDVEQGQAGWRNAPIENLSATEGLTFPFRNILLETIRNTYFHVSLWFAMTVLFMVSVYYSIRYLRGFQSIVDNRASAYTAVGILFGILGCVTGAFWARATWGTWWTFSEIKLNMAAIAMLIYVAYFILRSSFDQPERRARIAAVYNVFAFAALIPLIFVIPRVTEGSLHPGSGGNPGFGGDDLDNTMRMVFYPAIIGWILVGTWLANLLYRIKDVNDHLLYK